MIDKKTVFVLGAGASCPYGYPSGARLRERICLSQGFMNNYYDSGILGQFEQTAKEIKLRDIERFKDAFTKSRIKSIDLFMANNPKLAPIRKYIIAFEVFRAEQKSLFGEEAKLSKGSSLSFAQNRALELLPRPLFLGGDWYSHLYQRLIKELVGKDALPDFSDGKLVFITFNYDRSLEHFLYEALRNSFTEVSEDNIIKSLKKLKILHVYGQIAPLKWKNPNDYVDYKPRIDESLLQRAANNIRTIYEEKQNPELTEAQNLLKQAEQIFFLGFGYAEENLETLKLPDRTKRTTSIYGTAWGLESKEKSDIRRRIVEWLPAESPDQVRIGYLKSSQGMDCLRLLRNYL